MKPRPLYVVLWCLSALITSTSWADPIEVSASVVGQVGGRDGVDGADYFIGPAKILDFDQAFASVGPYQVAGGDHVNTGSVTGNALAKHPEQKGDLGLVGIDLLGSLTAIRDPTGGGGFFSAGSMTVGVQATAEYRDDVTFDFALSNVPLTVEGFVYLEGFAALDAVATGGINPRNVAARVAGRLTGANSSPTVFGTIKNAAGEITPVFPGATNLLDFNPVINFSYTFFSGVPTPLSLLLEMSGSAEFGDGTAATNAPGFATASFEAHFGNTLKWGGITRVVDGRTGEVVTDYRITSASGFDYTQVLTIPEPESMVMLLVGLGGLVRRRGAVRQR